MRKFNTDISKLTLCDNNSIYLHQYVQKMNSNQIYENVSFIKNLFPQVHIYANKISPTPLTGKI